MSHKPKISLASLSALSIWEQVIVKSFSYYTLGSIYYITGTIMLTATTESSTTAQKGVANCVSGRYFQEYISGFVPKMLSQLSGMMIRK